MPPRSESSEVSDEPEVLQRRYSAADWMLFVNFAASNFFVGAFYSLLGPFFLKKVIAKGSTPFVSGVILGIYELGVLVLSPVFGKYVYIIGAKRLFVSGLMMCGVFCIAFGFVDRLTTVPGFIAVCVTLRLLQGVGAGAVNTASFAIAGYRYPDNIGYIFGTLEMFSGLGMMIGPIIGGPLEENGGFYLPFVLSGSLLVILSVASVFLTPSDVRHLDDGQQGSGSIWQLAFSPTVLLCSILIVLGSAAINFTALTLQGEVLSTYGLSTTVGSTVYLCGPAVYMVMSPIWGRLSDLFPDDSEFVLVLGFIISAVSLWLLGPAPFLHIANRGPLWLVIVSQLMQGFGISTVIVVFKIMKQYTTLHNYEENISTFGIISSLFWSYFSLGALVGPMIGGGLQQRLSYAWSMTIFGIACLVMSLILLVYMLPRCCRRRHGEAERTPLLQVPA